MDAPRPRSPRVTEWSAAIAHQLLTRHGVVTRETIAHEPVAGGFSVVYQVLKAMEDAGRVRRGYFVAGLGAAQFAMPAALDLLRSLRDAPESFRAVVLSATDPASPYGSLVKWPASAWADEISQLQGPRRAKTHHEHDGGRGPTRTAGALVIVVDGYAGAYLRRGERELLLFMPSAEPNRSHATQAVARALVQLSAAREEGRRGMLLAEIDGLPASIHPATRIFVNEGFLPTAMGLQLRPPRPDRDSGFGIRDSESQDDDGDTPNPTEEVFANSSSLRRRSSSTGRSGSICTSASANSPRPTRATPPLPCTRTSCSPQLGESDLST